MKLREFNTIKDFLKGLLLPRIPISFFQLLHGNFCKLLISQEKSNVDILKGMKAQIMVDESKAVDEMMLVVSSYLVLPILEWDGQTTRKGIWTFINAFSSAQKLQSCLQIALVFDENFLQCILNSMDFISCFSIQEIILTMRFNYNKIQPLVHDGV